ncbi:39S ribosomal protein L28, mitochondrial-like [Argiope bruennichi]|uniref:39S ribosomal protein L28, mitochondrial-like n=1 Tax=Argiope bruennichi TaxID=94029 RepID=UPI0024956FFF|nr:39S ribosomal protein L28, mitochondrial-like [Argiope bruennichi]
MFKFFNVKSLKPHPNSVQARLPDAYKQYIESLKLPPTPVHYIPNDMKYELHPLTKERVRREDRPIPLKFPKEADEGIWGGEGVIQGFNKDKPKRRRFPQYWVPKLKKAVVYSEILNQYMEVTVTERTLRLIDQYYGFDHYILGSPVQDLKSQLALNIRRKLLLALLNEEKHHKDEATNQEVLEKYKKYMIPREEAEWFGLTEREAVQKQRLLEEETQPVPLKHAFRQKYIEELKRKAAGVVEENEGTSEAVEEQEERSWLSRFNPFSSRKNDEK